MRGLEKLRHIIGSQFFTHCSPAWEDSREMSDCLGAVSCLLLERGRFEVHSQSFEGQAPCPLSGSMSSLPGPVASPEGWEMEDGCCWSN